MSNILINKVSIIYSKLDPLINKHLFGSDETIEYEFIPLYTLNEIEIADIEKKNADTYKVLIDSEVITEQDALNDLQAKGQYLNVEHGNNGDEFDE